MGKTICLLMLCTSLVLVLSGCGSQPAVIQPKADNNSPEREAMRQRRDKAMDELP